MTVRQEELIIKDIVGERESRLRLQTSVRLRWVAILGQLAAVAIVTGLYGFAMPVGICLVLIALSAWLNVYLSIRFPARYQINTRRGMRWSGADAFLRPALRRGRVQLQTGALVSRVLFEGHRATR